MWSQRLLIQNYIMSANEHDMLQLKQTCLKLNKTQEFSGSPGLGLGAFTAIGPGSILGWETKISQSLCAYLHAKSLQSCPTLCDSMDSSLPGSSVCGILQARILE